MTTNIFSIIICIMLSLGANAGVIGDFSQTRNVPGYISFDEESSSFKGPQKLNEYNDGVITDTPSKLLKSFFDGPSINIAKIQKLIGDIENYRENARISYCQKKSYEKNLSQKKCKTGFSNKKMEKKWRTNKTNIALKISIDKLNNAIGLSFGIQKKNINKMESLGFLEVFFDGIELYQGLVKEDSQMGRWDGIPKYIISSKNVLTKMVIKKGRMEASNLIKSGDGSGDVFYSPEELEVIKNKGLDISLFNPIDSGFWRRPKGAISNFDTTNYNNKEKVILKRILNDNDIEKLFDPDENISVVYKFEKPKLTGDSPKFNVRYKKAKFKVKISTDRIGHKKSLDIGTEITKLVQGNEVNQEQVVNNLAAALGFTVDATYYKNKMKVFFEDEVYQNNQFDEKYKEFVKVLTERFDDSFNINSAINTVKVDQNTQRKYIELKHLQLERKSHKKADMNIGRFIRNGLGKNLKREHRAFSIFLAWIWDADTKDNNNKLKIIPYEKDGKTEYKVVFSNSDMGASLGFSRPNLYNYNFVKNVKRDRNFNPVSIRLNYFSIYPIENLKIVSLADARWIARLIGQLTQEQIEAAFYSAGYPRLVSRYYTGIMLKKRNQLLEALNMFGHTFKGFGGETITLKKSWEFEGSIDGFDEFFAKNNLTDPENKLFDPSRDPFPRYWGIGYKNIKGEPQADLVKLLKVSALTLAGNLTHSLIFDQMNITNQGFNFKEMELDDFELASKCSGNCFFQGFSQSGLEGFLPWRFIVENPNKDSINPYWVIDMFRYGFFLGNQVENAFGINLPTSYAFGVNGKFYHISEFIKIRPIKALPLFYKDPKKVLKSTLLSFKSAQRTFVSNIKEGEVLLKSTYLGLRTEAQFKPLDSIIPLVAPVVKLGGDLLKINRVTVLGEKNNNVFLGWGKLKYKSGSIGIDLMEVLDLPLVEKQISSLKNITRTFMFDLKDENQKNLIFSNISKMSGKNIPAKYSLKERLTKIKMKRFSFGLPGFYKRSVYKKKISVDFKDLKNNFKRKDLSYIKHIKKNKKTKKFGDIKSDYLVKASFGNDNKVYAKVKLDLRYGNVNKKVFNKILKKYSRVLPDNFILFDPNLVLQNFGVLKLNIETIFSNNSLKQIFSGSVSKINLCQKFSDIQNLNWSRSKCKKIAKIKYKRLKTLSRAMGKNKRSFILLWNRYQKARISYLRLISKNYYMKGKRDTQKALKQIVTTLFDTNKFKYQSMELFISLSSKESYYRRASMESELAAFPGNIESINEDKDSSGGYQPKPVMLREGLLGKFDIFSDEIHTAIEDLFLFKN